MQFSKLVERCRGAWKEGWTKDVNFRKAQLRGIVRLLEENTDAFCEALHKDLHKPRQEAIVMEINECRNEAVDALNNIDSWTKPRHVKKTLLFVADTAFIRKEPLGVVLVIGAWNYPVMLSISPLIGAIAAGNVVILKPSELSRHTAELIARLIPRYLDEECYHVVCGGVPETTELLKEKFDKIFFTGNSMVGRIVLQAAALNLTPVTLELGGKSPAYVSPDCDIGVTAHRLTWGKFCNAGQTCVAPDYVLCDEKTEARLVNSLRKSIDEFFTANPQNSADFARIVNDRHFQRVKALVDKTGKVAIGGKFVEKERYISPTVLSGVTPDDAIMQEEVFGPVLPIVRANSIDEAVDFINKREKPLALYVFSKNKRIIRRLVEGTSSGAVLANDTMIHLSLTTLPFGGVGNSGYGHYHGQFSFDCFSHHKACLIKDQRLESVLSVRYPPYSDGKIKFIKFLVKKGYSSRRGKFLFWAVAFCVIAAGVSILCKYCGTSAFCEWFGAIGKSLKLV